MEQYERTALEIAVAATNDPETLAAIVPCAADPQGNTCFEAIARDFGRVAWRRPPTDAEVTALVELAREAKQWGEGSFRAGIQYELAAILQAPDFIYVVELGEDGVLTADELATRLSLFILGRAPDPALLARAEAGALDDDEGLRTVATELLSAPGAYDNVRAHFDELLKIRELAGRTKDPELFPDYSIDLAESMREETLRFVTEALFVDNSYTTLFTADYTFMDDRLADFYGVDPVAGGTHEKRDLPAGQKRRGILTHPSVLAVHAHPDRNSPTRRGQFLQKTVLCNEIPPPPGDQDTSLPEPAEPTTLRARLEQHLQLGATCAGCHSQLDPPGFAFEFYDATGAYRTKDNGYPIDASGDVNNLGSWDDARGLADLVAQDPRTARCAVQNLYRFAIGHVDDHGQRQALDAVNEAFVAADHDFRELMVELALSPAFRTVGPAQ